MNMSNLGIQFWLLYSELTYHRCLTHRGPRKSDRSLWRWTFKQLILHDEWIDGNEEIHYVWTISMYIDEFTWWVYWSLLMVVSRFNKPNWTDLTQNGGKTPATNCCETMMSSWNLDDCALEVLENLHLLMMENLAHLMLHSLPFSLGIFHSYVSSSVPWFPKPIGSH